MQLLFQLPSPWRGRNRPCTAGEEQRFLVELTSIAEDCDSRIVTGWDHDDLVVVMTALRCAASPTEVLEVATGVNPWALKNAYCAIADQLAQASAAWRQLCNQERPCEQALQVLEKMMPVPVREIETARRVNRAVLAETINDKVQRVAEVHMRVDQVFSDIQTCDSDDDFEVAALGRILFHPNLDCLYLHPLLLPRRVGELSPQRLCSLTALG